MTTFLRMKIGGPFYFGMFAVLILGTLGLWALGKNKSKKWRDRLIRILLWGNLALHFVKMAIPSYIDEIPFSFSKLAPENYCALFVLVAPFFYQWGNKYLKDYLYYVGILSGIAAMAAPSKMTTYELDNISAFLEIGRYYVCHIIITMAPLLMALYGLHKLDYRRLWALPLTFGVAGIIVFLNAILMSFVLKVPGWPSTWEAMNDRASFVNQSATFGPPPSLDKAFGWYYAILIPYVFKYPFNGQTFFTPVLITWPGIIFLTATVGTFLSGPSQWRHIRADWAVFKQKRAIRKRK